MSGIAQVAFAGAQAAESVATGWAMTKIQMWSQGEFANMKLMATLHNAICLLEKAIGDSCKEIAR